MSTCDRDDYFDEEASQRVLDILVLDVNKVLGALVQKLERGLEVLDGHHLDAEVLHAHEKLDDVGVGGRDDLWRAVGVGRCRSGQASGLEVGGHAGRNVTRDVGGHGGQAGRAVGQRGTIW